MAESNQRSNGTGDEPRDPAEVIAGNPDAGTRSPGAPEGTLASPVGADEQGGPPAADPADAHSEATPGASAPPPPGAPVTADAATDDQQARVDALKAKIAALKAQKGIPDASPTPTVPTEATPAAAAPVAAAPAAATPVASSDAAPAGASAAPAGATGDADKEAKLAEMRAKIEAAKAAKGNAGGATVATATTAAATAAPAAGAAQATAASAAGTATATAPAATASTATRPPAAASRATAPTSPFAAKKPAAKTEESGVWYFGRRNFMQSVGWMSFFGFFSIMILGTLRAMFPRVIYEKPPVFKAGFPEDYVPGTVSELYKDEQRVWIIRQTDGSFIGLLAICTHLGCTPRWLAAENKFKCPCHGSGFRGTPTWGVNFEGPAPRPLERVAIHLAPDGQIEIDKSKKFLWEKGEWENPEATLKA